MVLGLCFFLPCARANMPRSTEAGEGAGAAVCASAEENPGQGVEGKVALASDAKAAYMMDWASGTEIYARNADERLPIASMCKIMTMILCFDEIDAGNLSLDEEISVIENDS